MTSQGPTQVIHEDGSTHPLPTCYPRRPPDLMVADACHFGFPDEPWVARNAPNDPAFEVWDVAGVPRRFFRAPGFGQPAEHGRVLVSLGGSVGALELKTRKFLWRRRALAVRDVSPDGSLAVLLVSARGRKKLSLVDVRTGDEVARLGSPMDCSFELWRPGPKRGYAFDRFNGTLQVWSEESGRYEIAGRPPLSLDDFDAELFTYGKQILRWSDGSSAGGSVTGVHGQTFWQIDLGGETRAKGTSGVACIVRPTTSDAICVLDLDGRLVALRSDGRGSELGADVVELTPSLRAALPEEVALVPQFTSCPAATLLAWEACPPLSGAVGAR